MDDDLYSKLYGETAPVTVRDTPSPAAHLATPPPTADVQQAEKPVLPPPPSASPLPQPSAGLASPPHEEEQAAAASDDEELNVHLDEQLPMGEEEEDDLDIKLDESRSVRPPARAAEPAASKPASEPAAPREATAVAAAPPKPAPKPQPGLHQGAGAAYHAPPVYDPNDPGVLPSQVTGPGQRVRLPGQTRVTPDEYKEFLDLGHGDIFQLDIDWVIDAPWRTPGADPGDFFNYGLRERSWKEYCQKVRQYQLEYTLQRRIQVYGRDREGAAPGHDADLPPELAAAVAERRQEDTQQRGQFGAAVSRQRYYAGGGNRRNRPPELMPASDARPNKRAATDSISQAEDLTLLTRQMLTEH